MKNENQSLEFDDIQLPEPDKLEFHEAPLEIDVIPLPVPEKLEFDDLLLPPPDLLEEKDF
jgi:hypothetical protein